MPAQRYSQYFNIDEKYYAVVTKELIDQGKVKWEGFYPHETFVQLLHQVVDMLSGKENKSIWVEGTYGTGKSHASLTVKCLLEASDDAVRAYFNDYGLSNDLCNKFLAARSEEISGKLIVVHRIGSSNIKSDDDLVWAVQESVSQALEKAGVENVAAGTIKDALIDWVNARPGNKNFLSGLVEDSPAMFGGMNLEEILSMLQSDDDNAIGRLMEKLIGLCRANHILAMNMDAEKLAAWIRDVIAANKLGAIVFIWDEFSEYFKNCQNSLTGFQTLVEVSQTTPFYFIIVTHESDGLIANASDRAKISNRFIEPKSRIELPDNMAFQLMHQAMKETNDPVMLQEWQKVKAALNSRLADVRSQITAGSRKHAKAGSKTIISDEDLQNIVPLHPYAALILKHISRVFTASQRSMFDFIVARDPDEGGKVDENVLACRAFKWYINHNSASSSQGFLMTVDMLWDFFNAKAGGNMNPDALEILNNYDTLNSEFHLNPEEQRVLKTVLLMNAICTRVQEADMLVPTYENIDLAFRGTGWTLGKAKGIAMGMVHRTPPLQPVLFEEPMQDGKMRVIPKATGGVDIEAIKNQVRQTLSTKDLAESIGFAQMLKVPDSLSGHFTLTMVYVNPRSVVTFNNSVKPAINRATADPNHFELCILVAMTDEERNEAGRQIQTSMREGIPENLLLLDATSNPFTVYLDNYITNKAYSEYYAKSDKQQSNQFGAYAQKNMTNWKEQVLAGEFRLYDMTHKNGQMRQGYSAICEVLKEINRVQYPFGIEQYNVTGTMFMRNLMAQGAECGLTETEKGAFNANGINRLSTALKDAWKVPGRYWEDPSKQGAVIVQLKRQVEKVIAEAFEKNGQIYVLEILHALQGKPYGLTPSNLSAFVLGFLLKEYANEQYFWSNGTTRPMSVELMKSAIKNALDQSATPKPGYRMEAIVTMSEDLRLFLQGTALIFHESAERCGSVDASGGVIRTGMKKLEFPIWVLKFLLDTVSVQTDTAVIQEVIDKYLGIANIRNYPSHTTESDLANEIGARFKEYPNLVKDLEALFVSQKCREAMKTYLTTYHNGELPALAAEIKDNGAYIAEVKKKFNADEANWVWSIDTANAKIDEVITEYSIIAESNTIVGQSVSLAGCVRSWKDRINNFKISLEAMAAETADLKELLDILYAIRQSQDNTIPEMKKKRFLELLRTQKNEFQHLYQHQEEVFKQIAQGWLHELSDEDISELFTEKMDTGVFCDASDKFFTNVEAKVNSFLDEQRSKRLAKMWRERTKTQNPLDWSRVYRTPILCMFDEQERQEAKEVCTILLKTKPTEAEYEKAAAWMENGTFYVRLASGEERDRCMRERVLEDYAMMLPDVEKVRDDLQAKAATTPPSEWMDNRIIQEKIKEMAGMKYKTGGSTKAKQAVEGLSIDELREYMRNLIDTDMSVGIAILKKQSH